VALHDQLLRLGWISQAGKDGIYAVSAKGRAKFGQIGIEIDGLEGGRRRVARGCLDWTERRQHLAGTAGAKLCLKFFDNGWVARIGSGRAVRLTPNGQAALQDLLGLPGID